MGSSVAYRRRRFTTVIVALLIFLAGFSYDAVGSRTGQPITQGQPAVQGALTTDSRLAVDVLNELPIKGRAPKTGYSRDQFSAGWGEIDGCSLRELVLARDLTDITKEEDGCKVLQGTLNDPYTGKVIQFQRGPTSSQAVQIDHIVAVSDAWQKGAQLLTPDERYRLYNDPLNLIAVDGKTNNNKSDGDAATWLPPNKAYRCRYVARQIAVKSKYALWVTQAEHDAIQQVLNTCPDQVLPVAS